MSEAKAKRRPRYEGVEAKLVTHPVVARMVGIDTDTLRAWVESGNWPEPHAVIRQTWLYRIEIIDHWIATGEWPEGARFKPGVGRGRQDPRPA